MDRERKKKKCYYYYYFYVLYWQIVSIYSITCSFIHRDVNQDMQEERILNSRQSSLAFRFFCFYIRKQNSWTSGKTHMTIQLIPWLLHQSMRIKNEKREKGKEREKGYISVIITHCHFFSLHSFFRPLLTNTVSKSINEVFFLYLIW